MTTYPLRNLPANSVMAQMISVARWGLVCADAYDFSQRHGVTVAFRSDGLKPDDALFLLGNRLRLLYTKAHTDPMMIEQVVKGEQGLNHEVLSSLLKAGNAVSVETELMFGAQGNRTRAIESLRAWSHDIFEQAGLDTDDAETMDGIRKFVTRCER